MTDPKIITTRRTPSSRLYNPVDADIELPNGKTVTWSYIEGPDICVVLAVESGYALLKTEWRLSQNKHVLETVSGRMDAGETPLQCAARELKEEIGLTATSVELLGVVPLWNHASVKAHIFLATGLTYDTATPDEDEFVTTKKVSLDGIINHVQAVGTNAQTLLALLLAKDAGKI